MFLAVVKCFSGVKFRDGKIRARNVESLESASQRYVGVVCSMKDTFGFIERADIVKEIFFHYSEFKGDISELILGDDVSFGVQIRNVSTSFLFSVLLTLLF